MRPTLSSGSDGALVFKDTDGHVFSTWDTVRDAPSPDCYTAVLFEAARDALRQLEDGTTRVVVFGLGAGVLAARFARVGVPSTTVEVDDDVVDVYRTVFRPLTARWAPRVETLAQVVRGDAVAYRPPPRSVVVVDVPTCYRDASVECARMLARLVDTERCVVLVNVWAVHARRFAQRNPSGAFVRDNGRGTLVWSRGW